jgi:hypothetical protein
VAGPAVSALGDLLPLPEVREELDAGGSGILDTSDGGEPLVTSYAAAGATGWTAVTPQDRDEFEGALTRSSRLVQYAVVALLLIAGAGLVVLHRKREAAMEVVALHDDLTGLHNRRGWFSLAAHELERARAAGHRPRADVHRPGRAQAGQRQPRPPRGRPRHRGRRCRAQPRRRGAPTSSAAWAVTSSCCCWATTGRPTSRDGG